MTALVKHPICRAGSPGAGCWAFDNTSDTTSISAKFYGLVVPDRHEPQLDNLTCREETEFWKLNFAIGFTALERIESQTGQGQTLLIGVNDGYYVGQSIPHVHSHVVITEENEGQEKFFSLRDVVKAFDSLRQIFSPAANLPPRRANVVCDLRDIADFTTRLKYARHVLGENGTDMFRIYTASGIQPDRWEVPFVIDAVSAENPVFSFSQAWRALNGRMPYERLRTPLGRGKYTHFEPAQSAP